MTAPTRSTRRAATDAPGIDAESVEHTDDGAGTAEGTAGGGPTLSVAIGWLMALLGFLIGSRVIFDNSFFTHFATGNQILSTGRVPTTDPYSFTAAGEPWTVQSWVPSVVYRGLYDAIGLGAVRVFNGVLAAVLTLGLWRLTEPARTLVARVGLIGAAITVGAMMWSPRPLLFGLVCLLVVIEVVEERRSVWWLLPVMWVWVNSHGSFPLAFAFIGASAVGLALEERVVPRHHLRVGAVAAVGLALGALNPVGPRLLVFPFELVTNDEALEDVVEWASPTFSRPSEWAFLVLVFLMVAAAKLGAGWRHLLPAFGFVVGGLLAVRNINPAALVLVACSAPAFAAAGGTLTGSDRGRPAKLIAATAVALGLTVGVWTLGQPGLKLDRYPVEAVDWLEANDLVAQPEVNLVHRDIVGNYLELRFGDEARVFIDDRYDFFPQTVIDDHATLYFGGDFAPILDRYEADAVLWQVDGTFADWLRDPANGWAITIEDDRWLVAVPASSS